ncbi:MAG: ankyrin repeat domain-containing protein [Alphaproteobacteria bacterium]
MLKELARKIFIPAFNPQAFVYAASVGDFLYVEKTLRRHPHAANWENKDGRTALHITHHWSVACALVGAGADIERSEPVTGTRPLHAAAQCGNEGIVKLLLDAGADIHARDAKGQQAIHMAAVSYAPGVLRLLAAKGADIDAVAMGFTPLMLAANDRRDNIVSDLLSLGADVTLKGPDGRTADQMVRSHSTLKLLAPAKQKNDAIRHAAVTETAVQQIVECLTEGTAATIAVKRPLKLARRVQA